MMALSEEFSCRDRDPLGTVAEVCTTIVVVIAGHQSPEFYRYVERVD